MVENLRNCYVVVVVMLLLLLLLFKKTFFCLENLITFLKKADMFCFCIKNSFELCFNILNEGGCFNLDTCP